MSNLYFHHLLNHLLNLSWRSACGKDLLSPTWKSRNERDLALARDWGAGGNNAWQAACEPWLTSMSSAPPLLATQVASGPVLPPLLDMQSAPGPALSLPPVDTRSAP